MKRVSEKKDFLNLLELCLPLACLGLFILLTTQVIANTEIQEEIIKQSEEYTIYSECTEIQGKYYCK